MASSKVMMSSSSKPKNSDLAPTSSSSPASRSLRFSSSADRRTTIRSPHDAGGIPRYSTPESALLDGQLALIDSDGRANNGSGNDHELANGAAEEVWREIVTGRKELKVEEEPDEMMTLEDFLAKAGAADVHGGDEVKLPPERLFSLDSVAANAIQLLDKVEGSIVGFGNGRMEVASVAAGVGRGKRGRAPVTEQLDRAQQQRQRRMIKNRESAARSRERKQAYQVELESLAVKLEEEHEQLLKEKEARTKERLKQVMENVVPVVERRKPPRTLKRVRSWVL